MEEDELKDHIKTLKRDLFGDTLGSAEWGGEVKRTQWSTMN
jgi:hypothetical protein